MRVLVTGAAGRVGYEIVKICVSEGFTVRAFDLPSVDWALLENESVEVFKGDITDKNSVERASSDVEVVIQLAALLPPRSEMNRDLTQKVNVEGTRTLVKSIRPDTRVIFASSIATYGVAAQGSPPIIETQEQVPYNIYAESKIDSERLIKESGKPYTILRVAPVSVADLLELPETVAYKADQRVECIYVEDAAHAFVKCLSEERNSVYNIGGGITWQMTGEEYLTRFYEALGVEVEPNYPEDYTAVHWYDTSKSLHLGYQRTNFNMFERKLVAIGEELGLR